MRARSGLETGLDLLFQVDRRIGSMVSAGVVAHHRRRLHRVEQDGILDVEDGAWAGGDPPPREGCTLEVLIDGEEAVPRMAADLAAADSHVYLAGWQFSPQFRMVRDSPTVILRNLLAELAERIDVYLLVWAGAPLPLFRPSRSQVAKCLDELRRDSRVRCAADSNERPLHCHHEKSIVIDDRIAFVGGIDLTLESGDRYDSPMHPARAEVGWHDVATRLEGPVVGDVAGHFRMRWREVTGEQLSDVPAPEPAGKHTVQIVRTLPEKIYATAPRGDFRILESYLRALRSAQSLIYLENQFLWSSEIAAVLREKLERPPADAFRLLLLLPAKPNSGADDTRGTLAELIEADDGAGRLLACTLYARHGRLRDPVYVHAKVGIVDDNWLTIGSANLNEHSLFNDSELNVVCRDTALVRDTRLRLWAEHLELERRQIDGDPTEVIDQKWKPIAREQLRRRDAGELLTHRLVELPKLSRRSERLLGPLQGLFVDG
jgi:phosphatidylserine/phosphatidylglycerophosphate/cardiolipin synthase-like enzyme